MADSRMERRLAEMGIRRAFGAPVKTLMLQILSENFLFTLIGGFAGLLFSYLLLSASERKCNRQRYEKNSRKILTTSEEAKKEKIWN